MAPAYVGAMTDAGDAGLAPLAGKLHRFAVDQFDVLAGFAACKFAKHGPGALFVFTNCGLDDLLVEHGDPKLPAARALRRQMILVWGGVTERAAEDCTVAKLSSALGERRRAEVLRSIEEKCDRDSFPLAVCAGPAFATEDVREGLRPAARPSGKRERESNETASHEGFSVLSLKYGDYRAALTHGIGMRLEDALVVELDDDDDAR